MTMTEPKPTDETEQRLWSTETMMTINRLTPDIKDKRADPDWFLLRQRFEEVDKALTHLKQLQAENEALRAQLDGG